MSIKFCKKYSNRNYIFNSNLPCFTKYVDFTDYIVYTLMYQVFLKFEKGEKYSIRINET